jgi:hypothetical protein
MPRPRISHRPTTKRAEFLFDFCTGLPVRLGIAILVRLLKLGSSPIVNRFACSSVTIATPLMW